QAYFYQPKAAFQVTDRIDFAEHNARFQAGVVVQTAELFHNEGKGDLDTIVKQLLEVNPPFSPKFLLETAERMMGCLTGERTKRVKFLMECLPLIETIHVYRTWWSEMKQELIRSGSLVEESGMRKEVKQMCKYITKHYSRDLSQKELADVVNLNATYAGKLFKRETGETIPDYINRIRIQEACTFLDQTTMKVYEVASATGFSDYRYFCKVFKHYAGATPSDYKDKQQSKERT
ncbi:MAG: response regulator, partial [Paenibacillus sp.]|nr:response regulator [Paenibacillus sp.]